MPSLPSPLERDAGVRTLTAPEPPNLGVNGLLLLVALGLLREAAVGSVLKEAAVRIGDGGRKAKACNTRKGYGPHDHSGSGQKTLDVASLQRISGSAQLAHITA